MTFQYIRLYKKVYLILDLRKKCSSDWEKLLEFETEGQEFAKFLRSLKLNNHNFTQTSMHTLWCSHISSLFVTSSSNADNCSTSMCLETIQKPPENAESEGKNILAKYLSFFFFVKKRMIFWSKGIKTLFVKISNL